MKSIIVLCLLISQFVGLMTAQSITISGIVRDQAPDTMKLCGTAGTANNSQGFTGTDFQLPMGNFTGGFDKGLVLPTLGADNTPVYAYNGTNPFRTVKSPDTFYRWFHDSSQTIRVPINLTLNQIGFNLYQYTSRQFFPIDGKGWNDFCLDQNGQPHNFGFCLEIHAMFQYLGGEIFDFLGDDDVWVFIDRKLVVDLGGVHPAMTASIYLDNLGLKVGKNYRFDFFFCERHTTSSTMQITTTMGLYCPYYDWCGVCQGDGQSCCSNLCDDNDPNTIDRCPVQVSPLNGGVCQHIPIVSSTTTTASASVTTTTGTTVTSAPTTTTTSSTTATATALPTPGPPRTAD